MNKTTIRIVCIIALLSAMMVMPASATTVTISPSDADSWISQYDIDSNFGTRSDMWVRSYEGSNYRGLVRFDLSSLPAGETIESAELWLMKGVVNALTERTHNAHRVTGNWIETGVTWNNQPSYDSTATDSVTITPGGSEIWLEWDVTSDVQLFADGTQNYGWLIKDGEEDIEFPPRGWFYHSREKDDPNRCPKLVVTYMEEESTPPTPFVLYGEVNYDTGDPVPNPTVTILNTNTDEPFDVNISGNAYQVSTDSTHVGAGDVLHFYASNDNVTEFNRTVASEEMDTGGFVQNITINHSGALTPDLIVTAINSYHNNTGCPAWFNLSNEIDVTVENIGDAAAGASSVSLYIDDVFFGRLPVSPLGVGASEIVTFENWKPIGEDCLQEPCVFEWSYKDYNFTGVADCDNDVAESDEGNNETTVVDRACYNGYTADEPLENVAHGKLNGGVLFTTGDSQYTGLYSAGSSVDAHYDITLPEGAGVELAHLNVYYTWHYECDTCPQIGVSITNATGTYVLPLEKAYNDHKCTCPGAAWVFPWGNYVYDLTDYIPGSGSYTVTVTRNVGPSVCVAARGIDLVYEDQNAPLIEYWINEGADVLIGGRRSDGGYLAWWECITNATFPASTEAGVVVNATLGVVSPWAGSSWEPGMTNYLFFNDVKVGTGVYHGYSSLYSETIGGITMHIGGTNGQVGVNVTSVTDLYLEGGDNVAGQCDDGDNMMPTNAFLVVEYAPSSPLPDLEITDILCMNGSKINTYDIFYNLTNNGDADAPESTSNLTIDGGRMKRDRVEALAAGETRTEYLVYRSKTAPGTIKVCADFKDSIAESDEDNNCLLVTV